ncbi:MAG: helix-turn-helix transcriptional regulator [Actinoplanes sp.]
MSAAATSPNTTGARVKYWRLRRNGMTQAVLAGLAGVSQSYISQVEAGRKIIDRRSTMVQIARALNVTVADLLGQPGDPTDPAKAGAADAVPAIWAALIEIEEGERRVPTFSLDRLQAEIGRVDELRAQSNYGLMTPLLPELLFESAARGGLALAQIAYQTSASLRHLGYRHLALPAAKIAVAAAREVDHAAWIGATRFAYTLGLPVEAAGIAGRAADRALVDLQSAAGSSVEARQILGQLHLSAGFMATVDGRTSEADAHLAAATSEAASLGDPEDGFGFNRSSFGPTNVGLWRMAMAAEVGDHGLVIELAKKVRPDPLRMANRHQAYWMTLGAALANSGRNDREALVAFIRAERVAPSTFAMNPVGRDAVVAMVRRARRRSVSGDLRVLARRVGIEADD